MQDASLFKTKDGRFPHTYMQAVDKLWGMAVVVRVYSGEASPIFVALNDGLTEVAPMILNLESEFFRNPKQGLMVAIRIMLYFQRAVNLYYRKARATAMPDVITLPDFDKLADDLRMQLYDTLPRVPDTWMETLATQVPLMAPEQPSPRIRGGGDSGPSASSSGPSTKVLNPVREPTAKALAKRWAEVKGSEGYDKLGSLGDHWTGSGSFDIPKDASGTEACLRYHLEKSCTSKCKHKAAHGCPDQSLLRSEWWSDTKR